MSEPSNDGSRDDAAAEISADGQASASDIVEGSPILRLLPASWRPYARLARLDRPIGAWLLLLPCWLGLAFAVAAGAAPLTWSIFLDGALFAVGALLMRGAGCTINDIADRNFDGKVARTALRPIPSGQVSVRQALVFLAGLMALGATVLFQFNALTIAVGLASLPLIVIYPFMKRITWWPQLFLGLTFNWGALVGWTAVADTLPLAPILLYIAGIFWTLGYDTIYAHQDKEDDALVGVKSTARLFQDGSRRWIGAFYASMIGWILFAGFSVGLHWTFVIGVGAAAWHLMRQATEVDLDDPSDCLNTFKSNRDVGFLLLAAFGLATAFGA